MDKEAGLNPAKPSLLACCGVSAHIMRIMMVDTRFVNGSLATRQANRCQFDSDQHATLTTRPAALCATEHKLLPGRNRARFDSRARQCPDGPAGLTKGADDAGNNPREA